MKDGKKRLLWCDRLRIVFFCCFIFMAMLASSGSAFYGVLMFAILVPFFAMETIMNRCPHCDRYLNRNRGQFCHHCGGRIREDRPDT